MGEYMLRGLRKNLDVIIIIIVVAFVFTIFYGTFTRRSQSPSQGAASAATVNNTVITIYDLENQFRNFISQFDNRYLNELDEQGINYLKRLTLESMINNELLYQEAKSRKIKVNNNDINTRLNEIKANFPSEKEFQNYLQYNGIRINDMRESIKRDLMITNLTNSLYESIVIPPEDINNYYEENKSLFSIPAQYHLYQMTFTSQEEAEKIYKRVNLGEDFSNLAKSSSTDTYASQGGDAGWISENALPNEAINVIKELKEKLGSVTPIVKVGNNYQFFKLIEYKPAEEKTFEESQEEIKVILENEQKKVKLEHLIAEIRDKSNIVYSESILASGLVSETSPTEPVESENSAAPSPESSEPTEIPNIISTPNP